MVQVVWVQPSLTSAKKMGIYEIANLKTNFSSYKLLPIDYAAIHTVSNEIFICNQRAMSILKSEEV